MMPPEMLAMIRDTLREHLAAFAGTRKGQCVQAIGRTIVTCRNEGRGPTTDEVAAVIALGLGPSNEGEP